MKSIVSIGLAAAGLLGAAPLSHAAVPFYTQLTTAASIDIDTDDTTPANVLIQSTTHVGTVNPMREIAEVWQWNYGDNAYGIAVSDAEAVFSGPNAGSLLIHKMGWRFNSSKPSSAGLNTFVGGTSLFDYAFTAEGDGTFEMSYDIKGFGDTSGLEGFYIYWSGLGGDEDLQNSFDPTVSGSFTRNIQAGQYYQFSIFNMGNISYAFPPTGDSYMTGRFDWRIREAGEPVVPGPAAALPFLGGLLIALKRRRR